MELILTAIHKCRLYYIQAKPKINLESAFAAVNVQKDITAPWNTDPGTDQWEGLIPENAHHPDQDTIEEDDPDPRIQDPNELQIEPHLQGDQYLHEDVLRAVGALEQLKHPQQQSLGPRPEHWLSLERKPKVESQSVGGQLFNIQPADV
ncbi:hypothetical protein SERLA73DRAFT_68733 [Serpula lacrymans var. lacrymans S7.3]|uniref:Uncharacterized protein n=2 Tax=Serpula lacrymans var. lacrymans TaxID=341189 RepID=F8PHZ2_SERL3|nr:hypothetical protein SERLA73DRAFT_68733 [Serpula lacrymans var. lacrymans S7.3]